MTDWIVPAGVLKGTDANEVNSGSSAGAELGSGAPAVDGSATAAPAKIREIAMAPSAAVSNTAGAARRKRLSMTSSYESVSPAAPSSASGTGLEQ